MFRTWLSGQKCGVPIGIIGNGDVSMVSATQHQKTPEDTAVVRKNVVNLMIFLRAMK